MAVRLYDLTDQWSDMFDRLEDYDTWEPEKNGDGEYIDEHGEVIKNASEYIKETREELKQAWFESLSAIEEMFEDKAVNIALYIKTLDAEAEAIKAEKMRLAARQSQKEKLAARLREYLIASMQQVKIKKIDSDPRTKISLKTNAPSVNVSDEKAFVKWAMTEHDELLRYKDPEIDKIAVKKALNDGEELPVYVKLVSTVSAIIK